jgi:hypothetical protein
MGAQSPTYAKVFDEAQQTQDLMRDVMKQQEGTSSRSWLRRG